LRQIRFQRSHPDAPWLTEPAVLFLETWLKPGDVGLEWGSGRSTVWFARRVGHLVSVEDNREWFDLVGAMLANDNLGARVDRRYVPCDLAEQDEPDSHPYADVTSKIADRSLDFALVDGNIRAACFRNVLPKIKPGGLLILDNANRYVPNYVGGRFTTVHQPLARPFSKLWEELIARVESWRSVITTDGIWDTRFWVRPCA
jgi:predicted O-methyltransferase YrrM